MKKIAKVFTLATSIAILAACSSTTGTAPTTFGGFTVEQLKQDQSANTVYFAFDRYDIEPEYMPRLDAQAAYLMSNTAEAVQVQGYTDERGTPEYNIALGQRRAEAVKAYLLGKGVNQAQLSTISYGEEKPAVLGHTAADYAKNRRAILAY